MQKYDAQENRVAAFIPTGTLEDGVGAASGIVPNEKRCSPEQRLASAVLTQAFRDLKRNEYAEEKCFNESARAFLLSETIEDHCNLATYCDVLELDPVFVQQMALKVLEPRS